MKCRKCNKKFQGNFCPYCGTKAVKDDVILESSKKDANDENTNTKSFLYIMIAERLKLTLYFLPVVAIMCAVASLGDDNLGAAILFFIAGIIITISFFVKNFCKKRRSRFIGIMVLLIAYCVMVAGIDNQEENENILNRLSQFAIIETEDENKIITFDFGQGYKLRYVDDLETNEFLIFSDYRICNCLYDYFVLDDIGTDGRFIYDFSDESFRIYTDFDARDGHISIIQYDTASGKYTIMDGDEWYNISDAFNEYLEAYDLVGIMQESYRVLENALNEIQITIEDVSSLRHKNVEQWLNHENIEEINNEENLLFSKNEIQRNIQLQNDFEQDSIQDYVSAYIGTWNDTYSQRCWLTIDYDAGYYFIDINWSSGASENTHWILKGEYNEEVGGIVYSGSEFIEGHNERCVYQDGEGVLFLDEGNILYWDDWKENAGKECRFIRAE